VTVCFYVSGHGFGHASRVIEVINALRERRPDLRVVVRTTAAPWLFNLTVRGPVDYHHGDVDTGVVQIDSLHLDADATVLRAREFMRTFDARVAAEAAFLRHQRAAMVVADLPPLGIAAAKRAGLPAIALGNFTWDWIYSGYPDTDDLVREIADVYADADIALRLPMHGGFASFGKTVDLPFVARRSAREPADTREALGLPASERLVLVSFGGYGLEGLDLDALSRLDGYVALVSGSVPLGDLPAGARSGRRGSLLPIDEHAMYNAGRRYEDLVRAVDVVATKPGYGIIAECVANRTAILYTSRGRFVEYDVLVQAMPRVLRCGYIAHHDLFAGRWRTALDAILTQPPPPESPPTNGAEVLARMITVELARH
jgi:UDP:flavonoid glycosyltransferase YjiC (YdhE family)